MQKLVRAGYGDEFTSLEKGVGDYVGSYLSFEKYC
jgi:hypothetical protein